MKKYKWLAKMGGIGAIASILFLPLAGCGIHVVTGIGMFASSDISAIVKVLLTISLVCAAAVISLKAAIPILASGAVGLATLITAYLMAKNAASVPVELKAGAYFALVAFALVLISGLLLLDVKIFKKYIRREKSLVGH
ncbi:MAG TPA: hypothetical protein VJC37_07150 [Planctomycetota bacterium]|nr:hypothetical protein [Planctomycetota bacterium]